MEGSASSSSSAYRDRRQAADSDDEELDNDTFHDTRPDLAGDGNDGTASEGSEEDVFHDSAELSDLIAQATKYKASGNMHFSAGRSSAALLDYKEGIQCLPKRKPDPPKGDKGKGKGRRDLAEGIDFDSDDDEESQKPKKEPVSEETPIRELVDEEDEQRFVAEAQKSDEEKQLEELRSVLWANIAACHLKLNEYSQAADAASKALEDNPRYVKALHRRAIANDKQQTWTSLTAALEDYNSLSKMSDVPASLRNEIRLAQRRLPGQIEERKAAETKEMMDKLKSLGNSFLGKFGLSTDNFQFTKNPGGEGYSMNFVQNNGRQ